MESLVEIEIQQCDIDKGHQCSACDCPYALAFNRTFGKEADAWVFSGSARFNRDGKRWKVALPLDSMEHIRHYDETGKMQPHRLTIDLSTATAFRAAAAESRGAGDTASSPAG